MQGGVRYKIWACSCGRGDKIRSEAPQALRAAAVTSFALFCAGSASADPKGLWLAQDGAHAKVGPCGAALCATIAALNPLTIQRPAGLGQTRTIPTRRDAAARLSACPVLYGLVPDGPGRWSGRLYNVDNGNSYAGRLLELGPATIRVEGCAIGICGGRNMTRIK